MLAALLFLVVLPLWNQALSPAPPAPRADCPMGCVVSPHGSVYRVTARDVYWLAKVVKAESGPRFVEAESSATAWALIQGFASRRDKDPDDGMTLAGWATSYSAACSRAWATGGTRYSPRITPRADKCRAATFADLPAKWRDFAVDVVRGRIPCKSAGLVHVLARGFEDSARDYLIGPWYATTEDVHPGGNAYYWTPETRRWPSWAVRILPASLPHRTILALAASATP